MFRAFYQTVSRKHSRRELFNKTFPDAKMRMSIISTVALGLLAVGGPATLAMACIPAVIISVFFPKLKIFAIILVSIVWSSQARVEHWEKIQLYFSDLIGSIYQQKLQSIALFLASVLICFFYSKMISRIQPSNFIRRHSFFLFVAALYLLSFTLPHYGQGTQAQDTLWKILLFTSIMSPFLYYELQCLGRKSRYTGWQRLIFFHPLWSFNFISPFGRGATTIEQVENVNIDGWEKTQLSGLRLSLWSTTLVLLYWILRTMTHSTEEIQDIPEFIKSFFGPLGFDVSKVYTLLQSQNLRQVGSFEIWLSVVFHFLFRTLRLAINGGKCVALARLFGFQLPRNTYRPFESKTFAEFFGRYNFFFKELLFAMFFFPVFTKFRIKPNRLRLFIAAFWAAGVGNFFLNFLYHYEAVAEKGLVEALCLYSPYLLYCGVLGLAIAVSLDGSMSTSSSETKRKFAGFERLVAVVRVILYSLFFAILQIFDVPFSGSLSKNWSILCGLFGIF